VASLANPTLSTLAKVQGVLEAADGPISRYQLHKRLGGAVNYPVLDAALGYFSSLKVVYDEGAGGKVLWVHNPGAAELFKASRPVKRRPVKRDLRQLVQDNRARILALARKHGASNVQLFGSVARGDARPESDIDLLVDFAPRRSMLDHIGLEQDLAELLGVHVDVVSRGALSKYIRDDVLREAVAI
jgi:uncharacterized protein